MEHRSTDVDDFADAVEGLVLDEGGFAFALGEVDEPMQDELDKAEDEAAGDGPDGGGMEDAMGGHAPRPDLNRPGGIIPEDQEMPVLAGGEELPLHGIIHQRMTGEQEKNDLDGIQPSVRRKWQQARHEEIFHREERTATHDSLVRQTIRLTGMP